MLHRRSYGAKTLLWRKDAPIWRKICKERGRKGRTRVADVECGGTALIVVVQIDVLSVLAMPRLDNLANCKIGVRI